MAGRILSEGEIYERWRVISQSADYGEASRILGVPRGTLWTWAKINRNKKPKTIDALAEDDIPIEQIIEISKKRNAARNAHAGAKIWQPVFIPESGPIVFAFMGDPHVDDDHCDWETLHADIKLLNLPGVYAANVGDITNNWTGRLIRLYASQETSRKTGYKLAKWLLCEAGIRWRVWVLGNHDTWEHGAAQMAALNRNKIVMEEWQAKVTLTFKNGFKCPVWIEHSFKGTSQFNKSHGAARAARERRGARIYAQGHHHEEHLTLERLADSPETFWTVKAAGYKKHSQYGVESGFPANDGFGGTMAFVIDPREKCHALQVLGFPTLRAAIAYRDAISTKKRAA